MFFKQRRATGNTQRSALVENALLLKGNRLKNDNTDRNFVAAALVILGCKVHLTEFVVSTFLYSENVFGTVDKTNLESQ